MYDRDSRVSNCHPSGLPTCKYGLLSGGAITSQNTMFDYVVASLSPEFATEFRDLILKPPGENPYSAIEE